MDEIRRLLDLYQKLALEVDADHEMDEEQPSSNFVSQFKVNGCSIIPPLMTDQKRREMVAYRNEAIKKQEAIEQRGKQKLIDKVQAIVDTITDQKGLPPSSEGVGSKPYKNSYPSSTSIVTLTSSGSGDFSPVNDDPDDVNPDVVNPDDVNSDGVNQNDVYPDVNLNDVTSEECPQIDTREKNSVKSKEVASSSSSGTDNSSLLQTVIPAADCPADQKFDSITVLNKDSNISESLLSSKHLNVQDSLDLEKVRESVSDSETLKNYLGEYSLLPTPGPSSTPDVSVVSSEYVGRFNGDTGRNMKDGDDQLISTATGTSYSFSTLGQSCTLPVSLVTESTCSTLHEVIEPWNMTEEPQSKDEKGSAESDEGKTPTPSHMRRNSYTLDYPSPALLEAQAQNRAPHVEGNNSRSKPVRRTLDLSDEFQDSILQNSSQENCLQQNKKINQMKINNSKTMSHENESTDNKYENVQSNIDTETKIGMNEIKDVGNISVAPSDTSQPVANDIKTSSCLSNVNVDAVVVNESDDESAMNVIFLQQQMDLLEEMQKKMMEEQQRQLQALMQQQRLQQVKLQEEMAGLEKQIRERNLPDQTSKKNSADGQGSKHMELLSGFGHQSLPITMSLTHEMVDKQSFIHEVPDYISPTKPYNSVSPDLCGDGRPTSMWTAPTLQNIKIHNGNHFDKVSAFAKGYLTRRLIKTDKVQSIIRTIKDMWQFIWQFQTETPVKKGVLSSSDTVLANRVLSQLQAAQFELHDIFFGISVCERMAIISHQRISEQEKSKTKKGQGQYISAATRKAIERRQQTRTAETKVFGRPKTAPPANYTHTQIQNTKQSGHTGKLTGSKESSEEKFSKSKPSKVTHGGISKAKCNSPSRKGRKSPHPFARPLSAASRRSTRASAPKL